MLKLVFISIYDNVIRAAEVQKEEYGVLASKMKSKRESLQKKMDEIHTEPEKLKIPCLAHGDCWTNNMMFQYHDASMSEAPPKDMMLIDWGNTMFRDPLLDLQYLIYTSTTLTLRKHHLDEILLHYHTTFIAATTDLGFTVDKWKFQDLMEDWMRTRLLGCMFGVTLTILTLSKSGKSLNKKKGTIPSNKFRAKIEIGISKILIAPMMKLFLHPSVEKLAISAMMKQFRELFLEVVSSNNESLQSRVFDLLNEAFEDGVFDN